MIKVVFYARVSTEEEKQVNYPLSKANGISGLFFLKNGDKDFSIPIGNNKIKTLCVSETGQYRAHTENIYSQKIRRIKKRSSKSWLYFNVYL